MSDVLTAAQAPGNHGQNQAESTVRMHVTHSNLKAEFMELRLDLHVRPMTAVKSACLCGASSAWQTCAFSPALSQSCRSCGQQRGLILEHVCMYSSHSTRLPYSWNLTVACTVTT